MNKTFAKQFLPVFIVSSVLLAITVGGCGSGEGTSSLPPIVVLPSPSSGPSTTPPPTPDEAVTTTGQYQNLAFTLTAPKRSYAVGETVPLTFTVQNMGTTEVKIGAASPYIAVGDVKNGAGAYVGSLVYRTSSRTTPYSQTIIPAGQTKTFLLEWSSQSNNGTPFDRIAPGNYAIHCYLAVYTVDGGSPTPTDLGTAPLIVTVQ